MSDAQYRLLIQRSFDEELSKQEHRALIDHLEASESGAKFHHQLDQMIQAAQDTPLPDELRPQNPEALARMIMEQLPQKKGSVFGFLGSLFGGGKPKQQSEPKNNGKAPAKAKSDKGKAKGKGKDKDFDADRDEMEESGASAARGPGIKFPRKAKEVDQEQIESQVGGISRLKSIGTKAQELENREAQSTTRSLGEKFSMPWAANQDMGEGPLTLAEHIKRKVTESQKLSPLDEDDLSGSPMDNTGGGGAFSSPAAFARQQIEQNPMPMGGAADEEKGWSAPAPSPGAGFGQAPAFGQAPSFNQAPAFNDENRGSAIGLAPKQAEPQAKAPTGGTEWGGGWGGGSASNNNLPAQPAPATNEPAAKSDWGAGWSQPTEGRTPLKSSESWAMPGSEGAGGWNQTPAKQEPAPQPVAEPAAKSNDPWGAPAQAPANESPAPAPAWGGEAAAPAPAPAWGGEAAAPAPAPAWGGEAAAPAPAPAWGGEAAAPAPAPAWGGEAAAPAPAPAWGGEAAAAPAPAPAWGGEASAPAPAPAWGGETAAPAPAPAWGGETAAPAAPAPAWGNEPAAAPAPAWGNEPAPAPAPAPAWGNEPAPAPAPAPAWGNEPAPAPAPAPAWGNEQPVAAQAPAPAWGNAPAAAPAPAPAPAWGNEQPVAAQAPAAQGGDAWGQAANWNAPAAPATAPAAADPWAQPPAAVATQAPGAPGQAQGGWGAQPAQAAPDANKPAQAGSKRSWATAEPDLIETGTFRAFTPTMDNQLGAKSRPEPPRPAASPFANTQVGGAPIGGGAPQGGGGGDNRWDLPIQERLKQASQMDGQIGVVQQPQQMPAPQAQAPAQAAPADNRWDLPIQERIKMQQDGQQMVGTAAPVTPVGMPGTPGSGIPVNQIVEKMGEVLQGGQPNATAQAADNRWDVPIQERNKQSQSQEQQPQQQPAWGQTQAPAPAQAPVSGWGNPEPTPAPAPAQAPVSGWGNPEPTPAPAPAQAPVSGWGNPEPAPAPAPAQAPVSGWGNPEPVQAQSAPQINQGWPQSQNQGASGWNQAAQAPAQAQSQSSSGEITDKGKGGGLFNIDDRGIDKIFDGIGVSESMGQSVVNTGGDVPQQAAPAPQQASPWATAQPAQQAQVPAQSFAPPVQPAAPAPQAAVANNPKGLFQLNDSEVDQIFNNIGVNEPSVPVVKTNDMPVPQQAAAGTSGWAQAPAPQMVESQAPAAPTGWGQTPQAAPGGWGMQPAAAAAQAPEAQAPAGWPSAAPPINPGWSAPAQAPVEAQQPGAFAVDDKVMNSIFAGAPGANQAPVQPVISAITPAPKIEGIGRLDASADNSNDQGSGRIAAIGKFLLDQKDLDKIGKLTSSDLAEGKLRILTTEASQDLQELLGQIGKQAGVLGSVIVGHDGLLIANTMPQDMDAESVGVWALGVYMNTEHVTKKMGHDRVHQVVSRTPKGYVVIADFGGGLLVTLTEGNDTDQLIPLMRTITLLVN